MFRYHLKSSCCHLLALLSSHSDLGTDVRALSLVDARWYKELGTLSVSLGYISELTLLRVGQ